VNLPQALWDFVFRSHERECIRRFVARSYGRYLAFKALKSLAAIPLLVIWLSGCAVFGIYRCIEALGQALLVAAGVVAIFFVESRWFSGYSYRHWRKVHRTDAGGEG
jgi:hypothetical protein